jgi:hypothetical protein
MDTIFVLCDGHTHMTHTLKLSYSHKQEETRRDISEGLVVFCLGYSLYNVAVGSSDCIASNDKIVSE